MLNWRMPFFLTLALLLTSCQNTANTSSIRAEGLAGAGALAIAGAASGPEFTLAFVGDVILHQRLRSREEKTGEGYAVIWSEVQSWLSAADLTYANLEGPVAPEIGGVSGYPRFNFPEKIIPALKDSGFDVVSTANNHALDRGAAGVRRTIENLNRFGLNYTGTVRDAAAEAAGGETWYVRAPLRAGLPQVAYLACTEHVNGHHDREHQVLFCLRDREKIAALVRELADRPDVAAVVLTPHWGEEDTFVIGPGRRQWARRMLDAGATAVVGSHPHVIQKIEMYRTADGRDAVIAYSLGNFISNQQAVPNKLGMIFYLRLQMQSDKGPQRTKSNRLRLAEARAAPLWLKREIQRDSTARYRLAAVWDFQALRPAQPEAARIWEANIPAEVRISGEAELRRFLKTKDVSEKTN